MNHITINVICKRGLDNLSQKESKQIFRNINVGTFITNAL